MRTQLEKKGKRVIEPKVSCERLLSSIKHMNTDAVKKAKESVVKESVAKKPEAKESGVKEPKAKVEVLTVENVKAWVSENTREKLGLVAETAETAETVETKKIETAKIVPVAVEVKPKIKSKNIEKTFMFINDLGDSFDKSLTWDQLNSELGLEGKGKNFAKTFFNNSLTIDALAKLHLAKIVTFDGGVRFCHNVEKTIEQRCEEFLSLFETHQELVVSRLVEREGMGTPIKMKLDFVTLEGESKTAICTALAKRMKDCYRSKRMLHNPTFCIQEHVIYFSSTEIEEGKLNPSSDLSAKLERDAELLKSMR